MSDRETSPYRRIADLERENQLLRDEINQQAICNGAGAERELAFRSTIAELQRENAGLRLTLNEAATSLCTISQQAGRTDELREMSQIRGYAFSRYSAAIDAARKEQP
jgi:hypothetical protein